MNALHTNDTYIGQSGEARGRGGPKTRVRRVWFRGRLGPWCAATRQRWQRRELKHSALRFAGPLKRTRDCITGRNLAKTHLACNFRIVLVQDALHQHRRVRGSEKHQPRKVCVPRCIFKENFFFGVEQAEGANLMFLAYKGGASKSLHIGGVREKDTTSWCFTTPPVSAN